MQTENQIKRNKRILLVVALVFTLGVLYATYDIMSRTTHPGARKHLPHSILK